MSKRAEIMKNIAHDSFNTIEKNYFPLKNT
jgi:hypothetical protein